MRTPGDLLGARDPSIAREEARLETNRRETKDASIESAQRIRGAQPEGY